MATDYSKVSSGMVNPGAAVGTALSTLASALPTKSEQIQMSMMKTIENELMEPMMLLGKDPSTYTDLDEPVKDAFSLYTNWKDSLSPSEQEIAMRNNINAMTFGNAYQKSAMSIGTAISKKIQDFGNEDIYAKIGMSKNLAPFLIHCRAPICSGVIYGQPKVGVVVQVSSLAVKMRCRDILSMFEVVD